MAVTDQPPVLTDQQDASLAILTARTKVAKLRFAIAEAEAMVAHLRFELADAAALLASLDLTRERERLAAELNTPAWQFDFDGGMFVRRGL